MLDKDKMIEEVAVAIEDQTNINIHHCRRAAKAAIKAMCAGLPEVTYQLGRVEEGGVIRNIDYFAIAGNYEKLPNNAKDLYNQLLSWGKDDTN